MRVGITADHGGFEMKEKLVPVLRQWGYTVIDARRPSVRPRRRLSRSRGASGPGGGAKKIACPGVKYDRAQPTYVWKHSRLRWQGGESRRYRQGVRSAAALGFGGRITTIRRTREHFYKPDVYAAQGLARRLYVPRQLVFVYQVHG